MIRSVAKEAVTMRPKSRPKTADGGPSASERIKAGILTAAVLLRLIAGGRVVRRDLAETFPR